MAVFTVESDTRGKCVSCRYYEITGTYWVHGLCKCPDNKIRSRQRWHNDKCTFWRTGGGL